MNATPTKSAHFEGCRRSERGLTAGEQRVAELAALGHTDRYIAGLPQISIKAVEWHLHQSYRKLDIDGRRQLPGALAALTA